MTSMPSRVYVESADSLTTKVIPQKTALREDKIERITSWQWQVGYHLLVDDASNRSRFAVQRSLVAGCDVHRFGDLAGFKLKIEPCFGRDL